MSVCCNFDLLLLIRSIIIFPKQEGSVLKSILFGSTEIDSEVLENFRNIGVAHVLAVSGLHTGIIYCLFVLCYDCSRWVTRQHFILTTIGLVGYVLLTGMSVSVIRASIMLWFLCLANLMDKKGDSFNFLCVAALLILFFSIRWHYLRYLFRCRLLQSFRSYCLCPL